METDDMAWARISYRTVYRCAHCTALVHAMRAAAASGGATAAMDVLRAHDGVICGAIEWMRWPMHVPVA